MKGIQGWQMTKYLNASGIHLFRRSLAKAWSAGGTCRSIWPIVLVCLLLAPAPPALCESVVVIGSPGPPLRVKQKPKIKVLFDGKPLPGANVKVSQLPPENISFALIADDKGEVVLPELSPGRYSISASPSSGAPYGTSFEVCLEPCPDDGLETTDLIVESLDGETRTIDRDSMGLSELWMDIGPAQDPSWARSIAAAEREPITQSMMELNGVVQDRTGAVIPGAWVDVVAKGTQGKKHVASFRADSAGRFSAKLAEGDYLIFVAAPGFRIHAIPITIVAKGSTDKLEVVLDVGNVTETLIVSDYRP